MKITIYVIEMFLLLIITTLAIMFTAASIDNIRVQNQIKEFINDATFERQVGNIKFYYIESDEIDEDTITLNYSSTGSMMNPTLGATGDLFVMPESRIDVIPFSMEFITYLFGGHAGVIIDNNMIVEAMGGTSNEMFVFKNYTDLFTEERTVVGLRVKDATKEERIKAANNANSLVGKPYNMLFVLNTKDRYYCTDLCHRIYSKEFGQRFKIDKNGFHVSCQDLIKSDETMITFVKIKEKGITHIYYLKNIKK